MRDAVSLTVVMPAYNEEALLDRSVLSLDEALRRSFTTYEIIVVDDGSTDGTATVLDQLVRRCPHLKTLHNARNAGLGASLRKGFERATGDLVLYTDADLPIDFAEIAPAVRRLVDEDLDLIVGRRTHRGPEPVLRKVYSVTYNALIRRLFAVPIGDVNFAFKLIRRQLLRELDLSAEGSLIDAELIVKALGRGARFAEIGMAALPRTAGRSHAASWRVIGKILLELVRLGRPMRRRSPAAGPTSPRRR
ncbi:MAG: glycosyltransferase family 2 protein [Deltaproteobacteria bacterium]|jgi:glycosyltransferase involved in cell wall biosynthesis|nr:glycosyltransferase family 2 protein [Deltaproteobacteria bacterium]MBW2531984.1 glycosyltransferase family 2 protein [Deltaproteobacteria bacterium]